jgi:hypothetical protein
MSVSMKEMAKIPTHPPIFAQPARSFHSQHI